MTETDDHSLAVNSKRAKSTNIASEDPPGARHGKEDVRMLVAECDARMDEVADLITRVRHEINNPLTGVLGQAQLLLREDLPEKARKRAKTIEELALRIRDIVAQLRSVQKTSKS